MDIATIKYQEKMLQLREDLLTVEEDRNTGQQGCTADELDVFLDGILNDS